MSPASNAVQRDAEEWSGKRRIPSWPAAALSYSNNNKAKWRAITMVLDTNSIGKLP